MSHSFDVVVVGAGILGTSVAYHLASSGVSCLVLERETIGAGQTGRSGGIIRVHYPNDVVAAMALRSLRFWQSSAETLGVVSGFEATGFLVYVGDNRLGALRTNIAALRALGVNTEFVTARQISELEPFIATDAIAGGAYEPESGYADPSTAAAGFMTAAKRLGARIMQGVGVHDIKSSHNRVTELRTSRGTFKANRVVVAAGLGSSALLGPHLGPIPITIKSDEVAFFLSPASIGGRVVRMANVDFLNGFYVRPEGPTGLLVGCTTNDENTSDNEPNSTLPFDVVERMASRVAHRFPALVDGSATSSYSASIDLTPDGQPIIGPVPGCDGLFVVTGGSGHCFKLSPAIGELMAAMVSGASFDAIEAETFSATRFARGQLVRSRNRYD